MVKMNENDYKRLFLFITVTSIIRGVTFIIGYDTDSAIASLLTGFIVTYFYDKLNEDKCRESDKKKKR